MFHNNFFFPRTGGRNYLAVDKNAYVRAWCILGLQVFVFFLYLAGGEFVSVCAGDDGIKLNASEEPPLDIFLGSGCLPCHHDGKQILQKTLLDSFLTRHRGFLRTFPDPCDLHTLTHRSV